MVNLTACGNSTSPKSTNHQKKEVIPQQKNPPTNQSEETKPSNQPKETNSIATKGNYQIEIQKLQTAIEDEMLRLDLICNCEEDGIVSIIDDDNRTIGPINIKKGPYTVYFLLGNTNSNYTLLFKSNTKKSAEFKLTKEIIQQHMNHNK